MLTKKILIHVILMFIPFKVTSVGPDIIATLDINHISVHVIR